jgi:CO/xanthine dehydrogenase Mo-binding subunit
VGHSFTAFGKECFLDEVIQQRGEDPIEYRLRHLQNNPRLAGVVSAVAALAGWSEIRDSGRHFGVAAHTCFGSSVAEIAEITVSSAGTINVERVWCAVDCGYAVNPDIVKMQMESGIVFGLTAALYGEINLVDGEVQESNFHDYPLLRMSESPAIEVVIVNSTDADAPLGGVGEPGTPPIAPAVANAVFAATGQRLRTLPLRLS